MSRCNVSTSLSMGIFLCFLALSIVVIPAAASMSGDVPLRINHPDDENQLNPDLAQVTDEHRANGRNAVSAANATLFGTKDEGNFGDRTALSADGSWALVGGTLNDNTGTDPGAAYLFQRPATGWTGTLSASQAKAIFKGAAAGDCFGQGIALSSDGSRVLVGAHQNSSTGTRAGAAYLFERPEGGFSGTIPAHKATATFMGIDDYDAFGRFGVALSSDGNRVLIGAELHSNPGIERAGTAYLFNRPASGWNRILSAANANATFTGTASYDHFGWKTALSPDGSHALIGAASSDLGGTDTGAAYLFAEPPEGWSGWIPAITANTIFKGGGSSDNYFSSGLSLSLDKKRVAIGAWGNDTAGENAGAVYLFEQPPGGWNGPIRADEANTIITGSTAGDQIGDNCVALSFNGTRIIVGAHGHGGDDGAAYLFERPKGGGNVTISTYDANVTFIGAGSGSDEQFGHSPSLSSDGTWALIGGPKNDHGGTDAGAAYLFGFPSDPRPFISSISPSYTPAGSSPFSLVVAGHNFTSISKIRWNGGDRATTFGDETVLSADISDSDVDKAGTADITVYDPINGTSDIWTFVITTGTKPTFSSITPGSGLLNTTINFSISGNNFQAGSLVNFTNATYGNVTATLTSTVKNKITGSVFFPPGAPKGKWDVIVTSIDGSNATKKGAFTVNPWKAPKISSVKPTSGYRNETTSFSLSGSDFESGAVVNFTNSTYGNVTAAIGTVSLTKITGTVFFPPDAPAAKWDLSIVTPDGGQGSPKKNAFTVNPWKTPTIKSVSPTSGLVNTTVNFTLSGTGFQTGAVVNFTNVTYPGGDLSTAITVVSPTKITGSLLIPYNAPTGKWSIVVTTPDGGQSLPKTGAFIVKDWSKPTITSINQTKGVHGTTINYAISGTNFQPGSTVNFTNSSAPLLNFTAAVTTLIPAKITGSVTIPADRIGKYGIEVRCPDGRVASKSNAFTIT